MDGVPGVKAEDESFGVGWAEQRLGTAMQQYTMINDMIGELSTRTDGVKRIIDTFVRSTKKVILTYLSIKHHSTDPHLEIIASTRQKTTVYET